MTWYPTPAQPRMTIAEIDRELATVRHRTVSTRSASGYSYAQLLDARRAITSGRQRDDVDCPERS